MSRRSRWGPDGPPEEAYSRVTDAGRFAPLHDAADEMIARLESDFDVERDEGWGLDDELEEKLTCARPSVRLSPVDPDGRADHGRILGLPGAPRAHRAVAHQAVSRVRLRRLRRLGRGRDRTVDDDGRRCDNRWASRGSRNPGGTVRGWPADNGALDARLRRRVQELQSRQGHRAPHVRGASSVGVGLEAVAAASIGQRTVAIPRSCGHNLPMREANVVDVRNRAEPHPWIPACAGMTILLRSQPREDAG